MDSCSISPVMSRQLGEGITRPPSNRQEGQINESRKSNERETIRSTHTANIIPSFHELSQRAGILNDNDSVFHAPMHVPNSAYNMQNEQPTQRSSIIQHGPIILTTEGSSVRYADQSSVTPISPSVQMNQLEPNQLERFLQSQREVQRRNSIAETTDIVSGNFVPTPSHRRHNSIDAANFSATFQMQPNNLAIGYNRGQGPVENVLMGQFSGGSFHPHSQIPVIYNPNGPNSLHPGNSVSLIEHAHTRQQAEIVGNRILTTFDEIRDHLNNLRGFTETFEQDLKNRRHTRQLSQQPSNSQQLIPHRNEISGEQYFFSQSDLNEVLENFSDSLISSASRGLDSTISTLHKLKSLKDEWKSFNQQALTRQELSSHNNNVPMPYNNSSFPEATSAIQIPGYAPRLGTFQVSQPVGPPETSIQTQVPGSTVVPGNRSTSHSSTRRRRTGASSNSRTRATRGRSRRSLSGSVTRDSVTFHVNPSNPEASDPASIEPPELNAQGGLNQDLSNTPRDIVCFQCKEESTPEWRRGPYGNRCLCNACGLFFNKLVKRYGIIEASFIMKERLRTGNGSNRKMPDT